jgi:hypothetical protein
LEAMDDDKIDETEYNSVSKYQEEEEIEGLTMYDIHRTPRAVTGVIHIRSDFVSS